MSENLGYINETYGEVEVIPFEDGTFMIALYDTLGRQSAIVSRESLEWLKLDIDKALEEGSG
jgi:hypothetical protein